MKEINVEIEGTPYPILINDGLRLQVGDLLLDRLGREGDVWLAREYLMRDLRDETETTMIVEEVEVGKPIPRKIFSERELVSGGN